MNRAQRRINANINKRGNHQPGRSPKFLVIGKQKYIHLVQEIPIFRKDELGNNLEQIGTRKVTHTRPVKSFKEKI